MAEHDTAYADAGTRYRLDERIAGGGMGEVWRATDTVLDRPVAVKVLRREHAADPVFRSRFEIEAQHAAALHHPGVAQVFDAGAGDGEHAPYLVMELVDGQPLSALLRAGEPMEPLAATALLAGVADALGAAHAQGIVHRDVKPGNVLVTEDRSVKITDFGIARAADAAQLTLTGEVLGTPQYLSPEQAQGEPATPASDVYSLGVVGFECLAGHRPYVAQTPVATALAHVREPVPDLPDTVPAPLGDVVRRSLAKDPAGRYADGAAFGAALREAVATDPTATAVMPTSAAALPVPARGPGAPPAAAGAWRERARRVPVPLWAAAGVLAVVLAVAALAGLQQQDGTGGSGVDQSPRTTGVPSSVAGTRNSTSGPTGPTSATAHDHGDEGNRGNRGNQGNQGNGEHGKAKGHDKHGEGDQ